MTDTLTTALDPHRFVEGRDFRMLIGDRLVDSGDGATYETIDPSTGAVLTRVPQASRADVDLAVEAALDAQPAWEELGVRGRAVLFYRLAEAIEEREEELASLDALDSGNPLDAMRVDVKISAQNLRDWPALALSLTGETVPEASKGNLHYTRYEPYGVVGRILAFNHPAMFAITRILAALIAGNTVVVKPGVQTPLSALAFGEICREILPPGVINVVTGGVEAGDAIVTHPAIKRIGFTGSIPTGRKIQQRAAESGVKHVSLELGGKNAMIVFPDADLDEVVPAARKGMNLEVCQGQSCGSTSRVFVHRELHNAFVERFAAELDTIRVGPAYHPDTQMGPLVSREHHERVMGYVESGRAEGATLVIGGEPPPDSDPGGYYLRPTLFDGVDMEMRIAREEIFGPVVSVFAWDDYESVIEEANSVEYGLTASIWTDNLHLAHKTAQRLQAGYIWINDSTIHYWGTPFGGFKSSGVGREESTDELKSYLELKAIHTILKDPSQAMRGMSQ